MPSGASRFRSAALTILFATGIVGSRAQEPHAALRGRVVDAIGGAPLSSASVVLSPSDPLIGTTTDSAGSFVLQGLPVGYYTVKVQHVGHEEMVIPELWLRAGKEEVVRVEMMPATLTLPAYTITAAAREAPAPLGVRTITVEQSLRYPATFFDPVRVITTTSGVALISDQSNHITVRGNSPNANAWMLEGAEIVNPNHLTNAGTSSDLPTLSGGGVTILSAQMLGHSQFLTGSLPANYGNALGGIMDLELRRGSVDQPEWTAQAGLLGIDLSTEGPLGKGRRSSYLVNYRYSTVGLLSAIGVDLGDEVITFQDLSIHLTLPFGAHGEVRLFGLGGTSSNVFEAERDTAQWEFDKDGKDITYTAQTGAAGITLATPLGDRSRLKITFVASGSDQERDEDDLAGDFSVMHSTDLSVNERKLSGMAQLDGAIGSRFRYGIGGSGMERTVRNVLDQEVIGWLVRPYLNGRYDITDRLQLGAGVAYAHFTFNGAEAIEPRGQLSWRMAHARKISLMAGIRSQLPWYQVINVHLNDEIPWNEDLGLTLSQDIVLGYDHPFNDRMSFHVEVYHQQLTDVPMPDPFYSFGGGSNENSMVNVWDEPVLIKLLNIGNAQNTGAELSFMRSFVSNTFYQANVSGFQSTWESAADEFDSRWSRGYIVNLLGGKEFKKATEDRVRTWGVSALLNIAGGLRESPIDQRISEDFGLTAYGDPPYSEQLGTCYRLDLRVYLKKDRNGRTGMWALDLQNATNAQNEAYRYWDVRKGEVVTKYQLGIIPNLSYRIEF